MNTDNFEKLAKKALSDDEYKLLTQNEEQDLYAKLNKLVNQKSRWIVVYIFIVTLIIFIAFIFFSINLFGSNDLREMIIGLYLTGFSLIMILGIKMYVWMQMNQKALLMELKKIELEIQIISASLNN